MSETQHQRELRKIINDLRAEDGYPIVPPPQEVTE